MRSIERSAIVPFTSETMFDLVADIAGYPQFLPGCTDARIHSQSAASVSASLWISRGPLQFELRTRNTLVRPAKITMQLERGPFSALAGSWTFVPISSEGAQVRLQLQFAFASRFADALLGPLLESLAGELVGAFARRARELQGAVPGTAGQDS